MATSRIDPTVRRKSVFLLGGVLYLVLLWFLWDTVVLYPLKIFVVFLHELSHGIAAVTTGGSIEAITLNPNQGGACLCPGGNAFLTLSSGYLGSLVWGAALLGVGLSKRWRPRFWTLGLGILVAVVTLFFVRSTFGIAFGLSIAVALVLVSRQLNSLWNRRVLIVLGLTSCLYAILDIKSDILDRPELRSDAAMLAELTGVPTIAWGFLWIGLALLICSIFLRRAFAKA